jgi:hypothetical protein
MHLWERIPGSLQGLHYTSFTAHRVSSSSKTQDCVDTIKIGNTLSHEPFYIFHGSYGDASAKQ